MAFRWSLFGGEDDDAGPAMTPSDTMCITLRSVHTIDRSVLSCDVNFFSQRQELLIVFSELIMAGFN
jgi:hypothetical protein